MRLVELCGSREAYHQNEHYINNRRLFDNYITSIQGA
jgi:hypothetical protein